MSIPVNDIVRDTAVYAGISKFQEEPLDTPTIINGAIISGLHEAVAKDYVYTYVAPHLGSVPANYRMMAMDFMSLFGCMYGVNKFYVKNPIFDMKKNAIKAATIAGVKKFMSN